MTQEQYRLKSLGLSVADHVSAMLAYWDKDLICRFANAAYIDWFGKTREEMVDKISIKELLGPLYEKNLAYITGALAGKAQTFEREITTPSGTKRHALANYFPDIVDGEVKGFFVHVADITHIKLLEKELFQSHVTIKDQNKRLLNFSNIVSHNLKSYAHNLKSMLNLFINARTEEEKDVTLNYLKSISTGFSTTVVNLTQIVEEVQNQSELKLEEVNLSRLAEQIKSAMKAEIRESNAIIQNNIAADLTHFGNSAYMESIFLNLISNAIKYRHPSRDPIIEISALAKDNKIRLSVKDNGIGLDLSKHKDDLFGLHKTFHGNADAKGIGLFITKLQVEAMNGSIEIESHENIGTTFSVLFPIVTAIKRDFELDFNNTN